MKYLYYPGCSLRGTARAYEESLLAVLRVLEIEIEELEDWNCCGATTYLSFDELTSYALAARNLALAAARRMDILAPCSACYLVLNKAQRYLREYAFIKDVVTHALDSVGLEYKDEIRVRHPLDVLFHDVGPQAIAAKVKQPLKGLKVAPYYGCQIVRPYSTFDDQRNPISMDRLLEACGAKAIYYPLKTRCCGGSQKGTLPDVGLDLIRYLLAEAKKEGADVIATVCPLCQFNLEVFQEEAGFGGSKSVPVLYFTQLLALAFGVPGREIGLQRSLVPVEPMLAMKELVHA